MYGYRGIRVAADPLARQACRVEIDILCYRTVNATDLLIKQKAAID